MKDLALTAYIRVAQAFDSGTKVEIPRVEPTQVKIQSVLMYVFTVMGAISVFIVTLAGFQYVMSQGDPQKVAKAKDTIIYAFVGLIVSIMSVSIIIFVVNNL